MAPPTYKTKPLPQYKSRDTSDVRKRPYPLQKPPATTQRKAVPSQEHKPAKSSMAKATVNVSKSVENPTEHNAKTAVEESKKAVDLMDFDDDLDVKGLREEPASEGDYELNPLMSRVLEKELRTVMIKVWQDLPDKPPTAAEKAVVDKLRTEAGDDLKNVLGLNVSKRLLNIHNPLYVKVSLSRKPDRVSLKEFVQAYNCIGLKYVPSQSQQHYTFVAQFKHFADFDRICTTKIVRCGNERVSIIPCYKFTTCPPHLKSIYSDSSRNSQNTEESQINKESVDIKTETTENLRNVTVKTEDQKPGAQKAAETKVNTDTNTKDTKSVHIKKENDAQKETAQNANAKPVVTKNSDNQSKKAEITPTKANEKPLPAKATTTPQQVTKTQAQTMAKANAAPAKTQSGNAAPAKTQLGNAAPAKIQSGNTTPAKTQSGNVTPAKTQSGTAAPAKAQSGTAAAAKTQAGNAAPAKTQSGNAAPAKTQLGNATPAKAQLGNATPAKTQLGNATPAKTQLGNATPARTQSENTTSAKTQSGNATPAKTQSGNAAPTKTQSENTTPAKTQSGNATPAKIQQQNTTSAKTETIKTPTKTPQNVQPQKPNPTKTIPQKASNNTKDAPKPVANANKKPIPKTPQKGNVKETTEEEDLTAKINEMIAIDEVYDDDEVGKADDDDILNDEDILAMMSGAIVLDECQGSDEE